MKNLIALVMVDHGGKRNFIKRTAESSMLLEIYHKYKSNRKIAAEISIEYNHKSGFPLLRFKKGNRVNLVVE